MPERYVSPISRYDFMRGSVPHILGDSIVEPVVRAGLCAIIFYINDAPLQTNIETIPLEKKQDTASRILDAVLKKCRSVDTLHGYANYRAFRSHIDKERELRRIVRHMA